MIKLKAILESIMKETLSFNDLLKTVDTGRKERSRQVRSRSIPVSVDENQESWNFRYKSNPSVTDTQFQGKITFFKEVNNGEDVSDIPCKVDCECPDFRYRFAYNDAEKDAADIGNKTLNRCTNQKPQPAYDYGIGMCKHLTALSSYLNTQIKNTKKSNLFEAMSEVSRQKNFEVPYYD